MDGKKIIACFNKVNTKFIVSSTQDFMSGIIKRMGDCHALNITRMPLHDDNINGV